MLENSKIKIIGHRGAAGIAFENTIASILTAIDFGVDCIEIDVWKTTDNEIIVFHDAYLDRLTSETGFVCEMNYENIKKVKLNNNDYIPTLKDVVNVVKKNKVQLLIEIKSENALNETLSILSNQLSYDDFIIGSFFHKDIKDLKEEKPDIQTSIMFESVPVLLNEYLNIVNPDFVTVSIETYNQYLIDTIKSQNRKLIFYTVNTEPEVKLAIKASPYAIVTNFPNLFKNGELYNQATNAQ